jgi:hypothetical protein
MKDMKETLKNIALHLFNAIMITALALGTLIAIIERL